MVTKNLSKTLGMYLVKMEHLTATDSSAYTFSGLGTASHSQLVNLDIINCLWLLKEEFYSLLVDYSGTCIFDALKEQLENITEHLRLIVESLYLFMTRDLEFVLLKMHREDYSR